MEQGRWPYGTFNAHTGTVYLNGSVNSALTTPFTYKVSGNNSFYDFVCDVTNAQVGQSLNAGATIVLRPV